LLKDSDMMVQATDAAGTTCCCRVGRLWGTSARSSRRMRAVVLRDCMKVGIFTAGAASGDLSRKTQVGEMVRVWSIDVRRGKTLLLLVVQV
jgi:hypothetical protein